MDFDAIADAVAYLREHPQEHGGNLYHPLPFAEFSVLACSSRGAEHLRCWKLVREALLAEFGQVQGLRVLDVGANAGCYAFRAALDGARVTAFEPQPVYSAVARAVVREKRLRVAWIESAYRVGALPADARFDAALVLSTFNWMAEGGKRMAEAGAELRDIASRSSVMLFEQGFDRGRSCLPAAQADHAAEAISLVRRWTDYTSFELLGTLRPWPGQPRPLICCGRTP